MTNDEMKNLQPGDIVRSKSGSLGYIVTTNYGTHITAVRIVDITNPTEWSIIQKSAQQAVAADAEAAAASGDLAAKGDHASRRG
jgi:hypothetical protein